MENKTFAGIMAALALAFDGGTLTKEKVQLYEENLKDIRLDVLAGAARKIIRTRKFSTLPTIGEIREEALGSVKDDITERGLRAWDLAGRSIITGFISVGDPDEFGRIERAVVLAFGSRERFGMTDPDADAFDRRHFLECYRIVSEKEERQENLLEQLRETREKIEATKPANRFLPAGDSIEVKP